MSLANVVCAQCGQYYAITDRAVILPWTCEECTAANEFQEAIRPTQSARPTAVSAPLGGFLLDESHQTATALLLDMQAQLLEAQTQLKNAETQLRGLKGACRVAKAEADVKAPEVKAVETCQE